MKAMDHHPLSRILQRGQMLVKIGTVSNEFGLMARIVTMAAANRSIAIGFFTLG